VKHRRAGSGHLPGGFLHDAGLVVLPGDVRPREGRAWLVAWRGTRGVLRTISMPRDSAALVTADMQWLHDYLARLAGAGFPSPRPLPCLRGRSWTADGDSIWEVVSYLPGHAVGWADAPSMEEVGALLGRYHAVAAQITMPSQRPSALPLAEVPAILTSDHLDLVPAERAAAIRRLADQLARDLDAASHQPADRLVIHGDFTNDNVIADGTPPAATGVIDFALAHVEDRVADIGYGLWRSGRPHEHADQLDLERVRRFVRGYATTARLPPDRAGIIPLYLRGRGLQMIAKRVRAGQNETGMLAQVQWLTVNAQAIADAVAAVC
jgi:Ser/Thr protein kinase RdoA (MazF antagonist)